MPGHELAIMGERPARGDRGLGVPPRRRAAAPTLAGVDSRGRRQLLLCGAAFAVLLAIALVAIHGAGSRPEAALYRAVEAYVDDLEAGELDRALARHAGAVGPQDQLFARAVVGHVGQIGAVRLAPGGRDGEVEVDWFGARGRRGYRTRMLWVWHPGRGWRVARIGLASA